MRKSYFAAVTRENRLIVAGTKRECAKQADRFARQSHDSAYVLLYDAAGNNKTILVANWQGVSGVVRQSL